MQGLINNIWLVPVYPLVAFLLIVLGRAFKTADGTPFLAKKEMAMLLTVGATALGLVHALAGVGWLLAQNPEHITPIEHNWLWLQAGKLSLSVGTLLDSMSVMMLFVVTFVSLLIQIYTHGYMEKDPGYCKFYAYLAVFNFSMLGLVLSSNLFQIYIFWELVGVCSYLLIGFWFTKPSAAAAAVKAFLMNRVGDFGLLIGILAFVYFSFSWWQEYLPLHPEMAMLSFRALGEAGPHALMGAGWSLFTVICLLIFMGPVAKSAQVPLHTWLPDAMEGPTPISALIHAATMVAAGIFLVGRVYPLFTLSIPAMAVVAAIGVLTAVVGATIALTQTDIKKALAYSTMSQLGFMMGAMGVGAFAAGLFHLFTHAFFKAMLFLCSGSVIHACEDEQDMHKMGGLMKKLPLTGWTYLIGTIAISGLFWTSGFWSKDEILVGAQQYSPILYGMLMITAGLTSFYMFRTFFMTFMGEYRGTAHVHHESKVMVIPLVILAVPSLLIGLLLSGALKGFPVFSQYIHFGTAHAEHAVGFFTPVGVTSLCLGLLGLLVAFLMYGLKNPVIRPEWVTRYLPPFYRLFSRKWYFDDVYGAFVQKVYLVFAGASAWFDRSVIDGLVNWTGGSVMGSGQAIRQLQSGKIQTYVAVLFFGILALTLLFIYWML